jgi:hypothetical protein
MSGPSPRVSLVINTLDRAALLADSLRAAQGLDYPELEIIVVNGPSCDGTEALLAGWQGKIKHAHCAERNLSMSRNVGIALAEGEIIAFMDDDAAPHPGWLTALAASFGDPRVGGVGGFTVDNTGARWQVRKTVCDRFGNAYHVGSHFDERPLNRPGTPFYPSLLGANSAFRAEALRGIGGFDETFAYFLDETDVCLRLVDAGWRVTYEPAALVFHRFAPSALRATDRIARTLYPSAVSKSYFIMTHGMRASPADAGAELGRFRADILRANDWLCLHADIDDAHRFSLDQDVALGIEEGTRIAIAPPRPRPRVDRPPTDSFTPFPRSGGMSLAFVSQGFEPAEAGIARWTSLAARVLAERGHQVHVLTRTSGPESIDYQSGLWVHRLKPVGKSASALAEYFDIPVAMAGWCARVWRQAQLLKSFGVQLISHPIWDLEGAAVAQDPDFASVLSLHTTYAMARPFKPEWNIRPLFARETVNRMIAAEKSLLAWAPMLLANSQAVVAEIETLYGIAVAPRAQQVPHGTTDPLVRLRARAEAREAQLATGAPLRVLFVGRFEARKGFDIAARAADAVLRAGRGVEVWFAGDKLAERDRDRLPPALLGPGVKFLGVVSREALDEAYVDCDLVLAPSRFESFGLVAIEAMAAGRPVLGLEAGGTAEVVESGVSGRLWPEREGVAEEIGAEILALEGDRERLAGLSRGARAAFEARYTLEIMASGLERVFRQAIAEHREARRG